MSEINVRWRKYGLRDNPYFVRPIAPDDPSLIASFVGRDKELKELNKVFQIGTDLRYLIVGEP